MDRGEGGGTNKVLMFFRFLDFLHPEWPVMSRLRRYWNLLPVIMASLLFLLWMNIPANRTGKLVTVQVSW